MSPDTPTTPESTLDIDPADPLLAELNAPQRDAVTHGEGPLLVLAGAGSGKTRVLTHRIAWLVERAGVDPRAILSLTFTNKAAREMAGRVEALLHGRTRGAWIGTFHAICLRILRNHAALTPVGGPFTVYDTDDQKRLAKQIVNELKLDPKQFKPQMLLSTVQRAKDDGRTLGDFDAPTYPFARAVHAFYSRYQERLVEARAMDFGDLMLETLRLFRTHPELVGHYARRFRHVLIDEYQDTNRTQFEIARLIASVWGNLCVVGDDDQSIYGWRGADLRNILSFEEHFPGARVVKLEQNYRSTVPILRAAASVIGHNEGRHKKTLWTAQEGGAPLESHAAPTEEEEAGWIVSSIQRLRGEGRPYGETAILYRTHALSRPLEEALLVERIPYVVYGGLRFYERREIKDALAYLRLAVYPDDPVAFARMVNVPTRGIGAQTVKKIFDASLHLGTGPFTAARSLIESKELAARAAKAVGAFLQMVDGWREAAPAASLCELLDRTLDESGYRVSLDNDTTEQGVDRLENLAELLNAAEAYEREEAQTTGQEALSGFLDRAALVSDQDRQEGQWDGVTLMTIHSAKGLEFPTVFLTGMEEGVFPHMLSSDSPEEIEEERRLCYVAMTRAREHLFLSRSRVRRVYGAESILRMASRFFSELPPEMQPTEYGVGAQPGDFGRGVQGGFGGGRESTAPAWSTASGFGATQPSPQAEEPMEPDEGGSYYLPEPQESAYRAEMRVRHPKYGAGKVASVEGSGPSAKVAVDFAGGGRKKFIAGLSGLEIYIEP